MTASLPSWLRQHESLDPEPIPGVSSPAKIVQDGRAWAAKVLPESAGRAPALVTSVARLAADPAPGLLRYHPIEPGVPPICIVREWAHGFPLLAVLRKRRTIEITDALPLVAGVAALLDEVAASNWSLPSALLGKIFVVFAPSTDMQTLAGLPALPIRSWPAFSWKLDGLSVSDALADHGSQDGQMTIIVSRKTTQAAPDTAGTRLAALLYELLGGNPEYLRQRHCPPLASLPEKANRTLKDALLRGHTGTCKELWESFTGALRSDGIEVRPSIVTPRLPPPPPRPAPPSWPGPPTLGQSARFAPDDAGPPFTLIARPKFRIGRSLEEADFLAWHWPDTPENRKLSDRVGRIHCVVRTGPDGLVILDGNARKPSVNGTYFDGEEVAADQPTRLDRRGVLHLGSRYAADVLPVHHRLPPAIESRFETPPDPRLPSAVLFLPLENGTPSRDSLWLLSTIGFSLNPAGRPLWNFDATGSNPAAFLHRDGGFWLLNLRLPAGTITLEGKSLDPGALAPLVHGQTLKFGAVAHRIEIA